MERVHTKDYGLAFADSLTTRGITDKIVIHHTGDGVDGDTGAKTIHQWHLKNGWAGIGYHYVIRKDGTIEIGRPHWTVGAHSAGDNYHTIGVHLSGDFEIGTPTEKQIEMTAMLLANICTDYGLPCDKKHIVGHRDLYATACPGKNCYRLIDTMIGKANWYKNQVEGATNVVEEKIDMTKTDKRSKYFSEEEIRCHGAGCCDGGADKVSSRLLELLDQLRENIGGALELSCAYRCPTHNANVGGVTNSQHVQGTAADVLKPSWVSFGEFKWYVEQLPFDGIGLYRDSEFIHVDVRNGGIGSKIYWEG